MVLLDSQGLKKKKPRGCLPGGRVVRPILRVDYFLSKHELSKSLHVKPEDKQRGIFAESPRSLGYVDQPP